MPYYLHVINAQPESGYPFGSKADALAERADGETVSFVASPEERERWQARELGRFGEKYQRVPWANDILVFYGSDTVVKAAETMRGHYAHLSTSHPGQIAYTPDDTFGHEDRQLRTTPARYLEKFGRELFSAAQIAKFTAIAKAATGEVKIARTAEEIVRVYCAKQSPESCMDGRNFSRDDSPVAVYGDSDLGIAYIGELGETDAASTISARCIVWPDRKLYGRAYGDYETIRAALERLGYELGDMGGAKVRAIPDGSRYLMPYVDGVETCGLSRDGRWFILGESGFDCQNTDGRTGEQNTCNRCGSGCDEDESYCSSCEADHYYCDGCGEDYWDSSDVEYFSERGECRCNRCAERTRHTCEVCDESFNEWDWSARNWRNRPDQSLCSGCENDYSYCDSCESYQENDTFGEHPKTGDHVCADCMPKPFRQPARPRGRLLRRWTVDALPVADIPCGDGSTWRVSAELYQPFGSLAIHPTMNDGRFWTVTHRISGRSIVQRAVSRNAAAALATELQALDWTFFDESSCAAETRELTRAIVARGTDNGLVAGYGWRG